MLFRRANILIIAVSLSALFHRTYGQELFILNEPASSVPKGVLGIRLYSHHYKEYSTNRTLGALRVMYGVTSKLSLLATASISNHHARKLPKDYTSITAMLVTKPTITHNQLSEALIIRIYSME